jgi:hypothetical protein
LIGDPIDIGQGDAMDLDVGDVHVFLAGTPKILAPTPSSTHLGGSMPDSHSTPTGISETRLARKGIRVPRRPRREHDGGRLVQFT